MPTERLRITPTTFRAGDFDIQNRYLRAGNTLSNFPVIRGVTMTFLHYNPTTFNIPFLAPRYSVAGHVMSAYWDAGRGNIISGGSFNADYSLVTT